MDAFLIVISVIVAFMIASNVSFRQGSYNFALIYSSVTVIILVSISLVLGIVVVRTLVDFESFVITNYVGFALTPVVILVAAFSTAGSVAIALDANKTAIITSKERKKYTQYAVFSYICIGMSVVFMHM